MNCLPFDFNLRPFGLEALLVLALLLLEPLRVLSVLIVVLLLENLGDLR